MLTPQQQQLAALLNSGNYAGAWQYAEANGPKGLNSKGLTANPLVASLETSGGLQSLGINPMNPQQMSQYYAAAASPTNDNYNVLGHNPYGSTQWGNASLWAGKDATINSQTAGDNQYADLARFGGMQPDPSFAKKWGPGILAAIATVATMGGAAPALGAALGAEGAGASMLGGGLIGAASGAGGAALSGGNIGQGALLGGIGGGVAPSLSGYLGGGPLGAAGAGAAMGGLSGAVRGQNPLTGALAGGLGGGLGYLGNQNFGQLGGSVGSMAGNYAGQQIGNQGGNMAVYGGGMIPQSPQMQQYMGPGQNPQQPYLGASNGLFGGGNGTGVNWGQIGSGLLGAGIGMYGMNQNQNMLNSASSTFQQQGGWNPYNVNTGYGGVQFQGPNQINSSLNPQFQGLLNNSAGVAGQAGNNVGGVLSGQTSTPGYAGVSPQLQGTASQTQNILGMLPGSSFMPGQQSNYQNTTSGLAGSANNLLGGQGPTSGFQGWQQNYNQMLGALQQQAAPGQNLQEMNLLNNLQASGNLGSTAGGYQQQGLQTALQAQNAGYQALAMQNANQVSQANVAQQQANLGLGQGMAGMYGNLANQGYQNYLGLSNTAAQRAQQNFGNYLNMFGAGNQAMVGQLGAYGGLMNAGNTSAMGFGQMTNSPLTQAGYLTGARGQLNQGAYNPMLQATQQNANANSGFLNYLGAGMGGALSPNGVSGLGGLIGSGLQRMFGGNTVTPYQDNTLNANAQPYDPNQGGYVTGNMPAYDPNANVDPYTGLPVY